MIARLSKEEVARFAPRLDRIAEARRIGLLPNPWARDWDRAIALTDQEFALLASAHGRIPPVVLRGLFQNPKVISALDPADPRHPIAETLLRAASIDPVGILASPKKYQPLLDEKDPLGSVQARLDLLRRLVRLREGASPSLQAEFLRLDEAKVAYLESLDDPGLAALFSRSVVEWRESPVAFRERVDVWRQVLTPELLGRARAQVQAPGFEKGLNKLVALRASWPKALLGLASVEEFRAHLADPAAVRSFVVVGNSAKPPHILDPEQADEWSGRADLPIHDERDGAHADRVRATLAMSGFDRILRRCVDAVEVVSPGDLGAASGSYDGLGKRLFLVEGGDPEDAARRPGTLFHETGHALEVYAASQPGGQAALDRYAAGVVYRDPSGPSAYPEAIAKLDGKEGHLYLRESFAEDFYFAFADPEALPPPRRRDLERVLAFALPDIDLEEMRARIRRMYGVLYGRTARGLRKDPGCGYVADFARHIGRARSERERERGKTKGA